MVFWSWVGAVFIGLTLGMLGSGGSIMTVPVLVYVVGEPSKLAIAESLGIVAVISLAGAIPFALKKGVDWRSVLFFGVPGMGGAYAGALLSQFTTGTVQLLLFAVIMLAAAVAMFRRPGPEPRAASGACQPLWLIALEGTAVGMVAGVVGVGGGFLIVPALALLVGLPMHLAVGTSLAIIALNSASGFVEYLDLLRDGSLAMNWDLVLLFAVLGTVGSFAGRKVGERLSQEHLRKGFAAFLVVMGVFILWQNAALLVG